MGGAGVLHQKGLIHAACRSDNGYNPGAYRRGMAGNPVYRLEGVADVTGFSDGPACEDYEAPILLTREGLKTVEAIVVELRADAARRSQERYHWQEWTPT